MGLIVPQWGWANCSTNLSGTPSASTIGTTVTAGASNADGTSVSLLGALAHDCEYLVLGIGNFSISAGNGSALLDILIDPAGGTTWAANPLINDLLAGYTGLPNGTVFGAMRWFHFPIWIKSGTSIGARARNARAATTAGSVVAFAYGGNSQPSSWWCGQSVTELGITPATSLGTSHTPGNTGVFSAWANLGAALPAPAGALQFAVSGGAQATMTSIAYFMEFGIGSTRIGPPHYCVASTSEAFSNLQSSGGPVFCDLASGSQLQVRGTASGTAQALDVAAYAVH
jgi:hypothetical protein